MYAAKIIADSLSPARHRLTTFEVTLPRIVLAELNTHRDKSRNSASSRAIPVEKRISAIMSEPFVPTAFGKNQRGMQASENLTGDDDARARAVWLAARDDAARHAAALAEIGVHKQLANRLIEPFAWHTVILTATEWDNHFALRCSPNAQDEIRIPTEIMCDLWKQSVPTPLGHGEWHLPFIYPEDRAEVSDPAALVKISTARCARVSYLTHDGIRSHAHDLELYDKLFSNGHVSPLEHPARPMDNMELDQAELVEFTVRRFNHSLKVVRLRGESARKFRADAEIAILAERTTYFCGNFNGWIQHRKEIPGEAVFGSAPRLN